MSRPLRMAVFNNPGASSDLPRGGVVTIGNFDGVHLGHQVLLSSTVARARELGVPAVALTFDPHPEKLLRPEAGLRLLSTRAQRYQLLDLCGLDALVELTFDRRFAELSAEQLAREFLQLRLEAREVRLGAGFRLGAGRHGDVASLTAIGRELGFDVVGVDPLAMGDEPVSSTRIRREVARGHVDEAGFLLGRSYLVDGRVAVGKRMGRKLGFPTINIEVENELLPAHGVYVTGVQIPSFGRVFSSVTNIGVRPTVYERSAVTVECHVVDFNADVYREDVRLFFLHRLRDERLFSSSMELVGQIRKDVAAARLYFLQHGLPEEELVLR
jgi:riboflavin kinase / FMN adenylyltransferase